MPTFSNIDGEESATVTFTVGAVSLTRNSSAELQEILCIGDPEVASSLGIARVTNTAPASTNAGLNVRIIGGPSSLADFPVRTIAPSTYGDGGLFRVAQSTATDLNMTVGNLSTTVNVSSLAGAVIVRSSAADALGTVYQSSFADLRATVHNSTIGDFLASVQQNSTVWQVQSKIQDSSAVGFIGTTTRPTTGAQGLVIREVLNDLQSTCFSTQGNNSTGQAIVSSVAAQRVKVYAYSITSTAQAVNTLSFASSLANPIWTLQMQAISSGITGANLAVSPPAWLFATAPSEALNFKVTGSTGTYHLSFSYFVEA